MKTFDDMETAVKEAIRISKKRSSLVRVDVPDLQRALVFAMGQQPGTTFDEDKYGVHVWSETQSGIAWELNIRQEDEIKVPVVFAEEDE